MGLPVPSLHHGVSLPAGGLSRAAFWGWRRCPPKEQGALGPAELRKSSPDGDPSTLPSFHPSLPLSLLSLPHPPVLPLSRPHSTSSDEAPNNHAAFRQTTALPVRGGRSGEGLVRHGSRGDPPSASCMGRWTQPALVSGNRCHEDLNCRTCQSLHCRDRPCALDGGKRVEAWEGLGPGRICRGM